MLNNKGEEVGIIYGWYNTLKDMWYVGQTVDPERRFKQHINDAINKKDNNIFHRALKKYGLDNFVYCILEDNILRDNLNMKEIEWIEYYDSYYSGYNLTLGGGGTVSRICTEETRKKISESRKGQTPWIFGKHHSDETKHKISESNKGKQIGIINPMYGKHHSKESREKMSEAMKGRNHPFYGTHRKESTKQKISSSNKGKHNFNGMYGKRHKESTKKKMSISNKNKSKVNKYDLNGNFICSYNSITEAIKQNPKAAHISDVCRGIRKQAAGFIWKYAS